MKHIKEANASMTIEKGRPDVGLESALRMERCSYVEKAAWKRARQARPTRSLPMSLDIGMSLLCSAGSEKQSVR